MRRSLVHNFGESLRKSLELSFESDWISFYKRIWPNALSIIRVDKHSRVQSRGIDRMIWLPSGKQILIDEKCREVDYQDILIEIESVVRNGRVEKPGWAVDNEKCCDFIAYAFPKGDPPRCYLLPFQLLKLATQVNCEHWKQSHKVITAKNQGYETRSVAVPWKVLSWAMVEQMNRVFGTPQELPKASDVGDQTNFDWKE